MRPVTLLTLHEGTWSLGVMLQLDFRLACSVAANPAVYPETLVVMRACTAEEVARIMPSDVNYTLEVVDSDHPIAAAIILKKPAREEVH